MNDQTDFWLRIALAFAAGVIIGYVVGFTVGSDNPGCRQPAYTELVRGNGEEHFKTVCANGVVK